MSYSPVRINQPFTSNPRLTIFLFRQTGSLCRLPQSPVGIRPESRRTPGILPQLSDSTSELSRNTTVWMQEKGFFGADFRLPAIGIRCRMKRRAAFEQRFGRPAASVATKPERCVRLVFSRIPQEPRAWQRSRPVGENRQRRHITEEVTRPPSRGFSRRCLRVRQPVDAVRHGKEKTQIAAVTAVRNYST